MRGVFAGLVIFAAAAAYVSMPQEESFAAPADEGTYFNNARRVRMFGVSHIPVLAKEYLASPRAKLLPNPGRVGQILVAALWLRIFPMTYRSLAMLSFVCFLLCLGASFHFARKYLGTDTALWYTTLLSSSPLLMAASRRLLQDSLLHLFWALSFWLFFDYLMTRDRRRLWIFGAALFAAITIKEQSIALLPFFGVSWLIFKFRYRKDLPVRDLLVALLAPPIAAAVLLTVCLGGVKNAIAMAACVLSVYFPPGRFSPATLSHVLAQAVGMDFSPGPFNRYNLYSLGPWYKFLVDFMLLTPMTTLLFVGYAFHLLLQRKLDAIRAYHMVFFAVIFSVLSSLYTRNVRYAISLEIVISLFAVFALQELFAAANKRITTHALSVSVFLIYLMNILNYHNIYVVWRTYDPISVQLLLTQRILPYFNFNP